MLGSCKDIVEMRWRIPIRVAIQLNRKDPFPDHACMVRPDSQFLAHVTSLSEVNFEQSQAAVWSDRYDSNSPPPMTSIFESIGKACIGGISTMPSATPCNTR